jgi:hypothetical protein
MFQVLDSKTESLSSVTYTFSTSADDCWDLPASTLPNLLIKQPERAEWECELFGTGRSIVFIPEKGKVPNCFWRLMQFLILGNKWVKRKK